MKWAAASLLALSALCAPTAGQARDDVLTASATATLGGFGEAFWSSCFVGRPPADQLRIAIAEIGSTTKFSESAARIVVNRIEKTLESDPLFVVVPLRLSSELQEIRKELQETGPLAPGGHLDGFIRITPDGDANGQTAVAVTAYTADLKCQRSADSEVRVGDLKDPPDDPEAYFRAVAATRGLDERQVAHLVVMPPKIGYGIGYGNATRDWARRLQDQLAAAIWRTFSDRISWRLNDAPVPSVSRWEDGAPPAGAWRALMDLDRTDRGIEVRVKFYSPADPPYVVYTPTGHFPEDALPKNLDRPALLMPEVKTFKVNDDPFVVEVDVVKERSRLFCFFQERNGEATLLYPTTLASNLFSPGKKRFPDDFFTGMSRSWTLNEANDFFFRCGAIKGPVAADLLTRWIQNTVPARKQRGEKDSVDPDTANEIISKLQQSDGYTETATHIVAK